MIARRARIVDVDTAALRLRLQPFRQHGVRLVDALLVKNRCEFGKLATFDHRQTDHLNPFPVRRLIDIDQKIRPIASSSGRSS